MIRLLVVSWLVCLALLSFSSQVQAQAQPQPSLKYNEIRQKNSHNSYERREGLSDMLVYSHLRSLEIDCHRGKQNGQFYVYHDAGMFQSYSSIGTLQDGIRILQDFHENFPTHHVVSIFMDIKKGLNSDTHTAQDLDGYLEQLPLFTPADLLAVANRSSTPPESLAESVGQFGWPDIEDMRGKFLFVITDGQDSYCMDNDGCNTAKAFVGSSAVAAQDVGAKPYVVFYNQPNHHETNRELLSAIRDGAFVSRVYDHADMNTPEKWNQAMKDGYNIIATDRTNFHRDPFSRTHNQYGFPFQSLKEDVQLEVNTMEPKEGGSVMYMYADTGDTWGLQDDLHYRYLNVSSTIGEWMEYTTSVSVVNSHCEKFAKAGIMLRAEKEEEGYPIGTGQYFAILRCCEDLMRVQYRELAYMFSIAEPIPALLGSSRIGIEAAKLMSMKLRYMWDGQHTYAEAYFMVPGNVTGDNQDRYVLIQRQNFAGVKFDYVGLFASSHNFGGFDDHSKFKALFLNTKENGEVMTSKDFPYQHNSNVKVSGLREPFQSFGDGYYSPHDNVRWPSQYARRKMIVDGKERQIRH